MERLLCVLAALLLLAGCAALRDLPRDDRSRVFAISPERLAEATAAVLRAEGFYVRRMPAPASAPAAAVLVTDYRWDTYDQRQWVEATVLPIGDSARVAVRLRAERSSLADDRPWAPVALSREQVRQQYARYLALIADRL